MTADVMAPDPGREQLIYARYLAIGMYIGLATLLVTFVLYTANVFHPAVPISELPRYWGLSVGEYLEAINANHLHQHGHLTGWWWLRELIAGDCLCFLGIAVLSTVTIVCFLRITPVFLRGRDFAYAAMAAAEVAILVLAASGILSVGH